jgi:hypothetical protein
MNNETDKMKKSVLSDSLKSESLKSAFKVYLRDWELSGYIVTNAISSGAFLLLFVGLFLNHILEQPFMTVRPSAIYSGTIISLLFLVVTAILLVRDIVDYPKFFRGLIHPKQGSKFVFGAYAILIYGVLMSGFAISISFKIKALSIFLIYITALSALVVSLSTTYLLQQRKLPLKWNNFTLSMHMLTHSFMAGGAAYSITDAFFHIGTTWGFYVDMVLHIAIISNIIINLIEFVFTWKNNHQSDLVQEIISGKFKKLFWIGNVFIGNIIPFILIYFSDLPILQTLAGIFIISGIWIFDRIWIAAPAFVSHKYNSLNVINNE